MTYFFIIGSIYLTFKVIDIVIEIVKGAIDKINKLNEERYGYTYIDYKNIKRENKLNRKMRKIGFINDSEKP